MCRKRIHNGYVVEKQVLNGGIKDFYRLNLRLYEIKIIYKYPSFKFSLRNSIIQIKRIISDKESLFVLPQDQINDKESK